MAHFPIKYTHDEHTELYVRCTDVIELGIPYAAMLEVYSV